MDLTYARWVMLGSLLAVTAGCGSAPQPKPPSVIVNCGASGRPIYGVAEVKISAAAPDTAVIAYRDADTNKPTTLTLRPGQTCTVSPGGPGNPE